MKNQFNAFQNFRRKKGVHQSEIAKHLNISKGAYSSKERGFHEFTLSEAHKISKMFGISIDEFYEMLTDWKRSV